MSVAAEKRLELPDDKAFLILADPSPNLRRLALIDLFGKSQDDPEVLELEALRESDPPATELLRTQRPDGSWASALGARDVSSTAAALARLGRLGFGPGYPAVRRGAEFLFSMRGPDGSWPISKDGNDEGEIDETADGYAIIPLQTAIPLRGLSACGFATDPRAELAYDWLMSKRLDDGTWPTGWAKSGVYGRVAGYRRLPHSRWGCRSTTTAALVCLANHPVRRTSPEAARALDQLLGRETRDEYSLGFEAARIIGAEKSRGMFTFYAPFDAALSLRLCAEIGAPMSDERVRDLIGFILGSRGKYGLWEYRRKPQASRWVSFDILRSLSLLKEENRDWAPVEPRTPFQAYPKREKRY